jgi:integrase/recombinase XerD
MDIIELVKKEALRRRYSYKTIKVYCYCLKKFLNTYPNTDPRAIKKADVQKYLDKFVAKDAPGNTINVHLNAIKFMYEEVLRKKLTVNIRYAKTPRRLPEVLTKEETQLLFSTLSNKKHLLMITLMYSAGLRVNELVHLKVQDFQLDKNFGWVREGKGGKDRLFIIAKRMKHDLVEWIKENNLLEKNWLFRGRGKTHITTRTIQAIVKQMKKKAKLSKNVHPHTLRHSFATHLIENDYAITDVQSLLGHSSPETTMMYTHMASPKMLNVESPFDTLDKKNVSKLNKKT